MAKANAKGSTVVVWKDALPKDIEWIPINVPKAKRRTCQKHYGKEIPRIKYRRGVT